jgi:LysR family transcriptional activator of nhaA
LKRNFPQSLNDLPLLLPHPGTPLREQLDGWMAEQDIKPRIVGEYQDSALLKVFGQAGTGIFPAPSALVKEIERQYDVIEIGQTDRVKERFYAISVERRLTNPAVIAITKQAKQLFSKG